MVEDELLKRITANPKIFGGKPITRGRRLAVEHVLGMLAAGDTAETILEGYPWLEKADILASLAYAQDRRARTGGTSADRDPHVKLLLDACAWGGAQAIVGEGTIT